MGGWISRSMQVGAVLSCPRMLCGAIPPPTWCLSSPQSQPGCSFLDFLKLCHSTVTRAVIPHTNGIMLNGKWTKYTTFTHKKSGSHPFKEYQLMAFDGQLVTEIHWLPLGRLVSIKCAVAGRLRIIAGGTEPKWLSSFMNEIIKEPMKLIDAVRKIAEAIRGLSPNYC